MPNQPRYYHRLTANYEIGKFSINGIWDYRSKIWSSDGNVVSLPGFSEFAAGVTFSYSDFQINATMYNIFDTTGAYFGNTNDDFLTSAGAAEGVPRLSIPNFPRYWTASVTYRF